MILADKIISLRKKAGWSQEEMARQLGVTRQSVSKWEGAQSVPDLDKVLQMSRLFGVSTDYLLKDDAGEEQPAAAAEDESPVHQVTMEQASQYLALRQEAAPKLALATFLCVLSPIPLIALAGLSDMGRLRENAAAGLGLCVMIGLVAVAVVLFLNCASQSKAYEFMTKEPFETAYGVEGMVRQRMRDSQKSYNRLNAIGVVLCILSILPLFASLCFSTSDIVYLAAVCLLLLAAGVACIFFVYGGVYHSALEKLLEEGEFTRTRKAKSGLFSAITACYWMVVTAVFLIYTFGPQGNGNPRYSWVVWAVGGVLYGGLAAILSAIGRK